MKILRSSSFIALLFVALVAAPAGAARALAPEYVSSNPEDGAMLDEAPDRVEVTFSEPLDPSSDLSVQDECGRPIDDGEVETQANTMSVGIAIKPIGTYKVTYLAKGVGGVTGQETGSFTFMVHHGPSCNAKKPGGGGGHGNHQNNGGGGSGNHQGGHGNNGSGGGQHSGMGGGGNHSSMDHSTSGGSSTDHSSMDDHSSMGHTKGSTAHRKMGKHGDRNHGNGKHGKHGKAGAHGLLDLLDKNKNDDSGAFAAGPDSIPAPDGRAVIAALALSLAMGVVGGWFLRVSGAR